MDPEQLFHASQLELLIPSYSSCPSQPEDPSSSSWWTDAQNARTRDTAYLDEHLEYFVGLSIDDGDRGSKGPSHEMKHFLSRLQLTMTASFLSPLPREGSQPSTGTRSTSSHLQPDATPRQTETNLDFPPVTPMPQPAVKDGDEQYAAAEGQVVWEGQITDKYQIYKGDQGWVAVWKSEVKIEYMRTNIRDPVLALTASVTLRDAPVKPGHKRGNFSIDTISTRTGGDDYDEEEADYGGDGLARMNQFDLLGGLVEDSGGLPATRLGQRIREDLSIAETSSRVVPSLSSQATPETSSPAWATGDRAIPNSSTTTTLRKSYRRVLAMHSGLNVRMRALCLPQLLPPNATDDDENEGEKKMVLCIEIVNPEHEGMAFEIEAVNIEIAGNGGKATAEMVCQPGHQPGEDLFPLLLQPVEQYNLLYGVDIAAAPEERGSGDQAVMRMMDRGDDTRPAAIFVVARPCISLGDDKFEYPTKSFNTRWNSQLDLAVFYASLSTSPNAIPSGQQYALSKGPVVPPNPVAGDKRFSIASFASTTDQSQSQSQVGRDPRRLTQRPIMPSQAMIGRVQSMRQTSGSTSSAGLLVSVKLLPNSQNGISGTNDQTQSSVKPFEPFSVEVFIHNRTDEVRRFRLSIPPRDGDAQIRDTIDKRKSQHQSMIQDDPVMRQMLMRHLASAPALVPLEADIRCGPLLPGASFAARIRFMALREGVHKVEKLVITGVGDDWNFVMSPVLDVVVV